MKHSTNIVMISGPSGSGKDSVIDGLKEKGIPIERVITTTSRQIRPKESNGKPYYFISSQDFDKLIQENKMVEWAPVYDQKYGTTLKELERVKKLKNKIGVWRTDWQGVVAGKKLIPDILTISILPPDFETLINRLTKRGSETKEQIEKRMNPKERRKYETDLFDYKVTNEENKLDETIDKITDILKKESHLVDKN